MIDAEMEHLSACYVFRENTCTEVLAEVRTEKLCLTDLAARVSASK